MPPSWRPKSIPGVVEERPNLLEAQVIVEVAEPSPKPRELPTVTESVILSNLTNVPLSTQPPAPPAPPLSEPQERVPSPSVSIVSQFVRPVILNPVLRIDVPPDRKSTR